MDKTFIEKRIEERAGAKLQAEYTQFFNLLYKSPFSAKLKIDGKKLIGSDNSTDDQIYKSYVHWIEPNSNLGKLIQARREELIKIESDEIISRLDNIKYLFEQIQ